MQCKWTFVIRFTVSAPQRRLFMIRQQQKNALRSLAVIARCITMIYTRVHNLFVIADHITFIFMNYGRHRFQDIFRFAFLLFCFYTLSLANFQTSVWLSFCYACSRSRPEFSNAASGMWPVKAFCAARDAFCEYSYIQHLSYFVHSPVFESSRPASEQVPFKRKYSRDG